MLRSAWCHLSAHVDISLHGHRGTTITDWGAICEQRVLAHDASAIQQILLAAVIDQQLWQLVAHPLDLTASQSTLSRRKKTLAALSTRFPERPRDHFCGQASPSGPPTEESVA